MQNFVERGQFMQISSSLESDSQPSSINNLPMLHNLVVIIKSVFDMGLLILIPMFFPLVRGDNPRALARKTRG